MNNTKKFNRDWGKVKKKAPKKCKSCLYLGVIYDNGQPEALCSFKRLCYGNPINKIYDKKVLAGVMPHLKHEEFGKPKEIIKFAEYRS